LNLQDNNRFDDFFAENKYVLLKNYLYNYLLRKRAIENSFQNEKWELILEIGSGISPVMTRTDKIIYTDLSFAAVNFMKNNFKRGHCLVADAMNLPFKTGAFTHAVCSEVLEHLEDDCKALREISRVVKPRGKIMLTIPHRKAYFTNDDRYVKHYRRYETEEIAGQLAAAGFNVHKSEKVLGPLEKITMSLLIFCLSAFKGRKNSRENSYKGAAKKYMVAIFKWLNFTYMGLAWLDARLMPDSLSAVKLIIAQKAENCNE